MNLKIRTASGDVDIRDVELCCFHVGLSLFNATVDMTLQLNEEMLPVDAANIDLRTVCTKCSHDVRMHLELP